MPRLFIYQSPKSIPDHRAIESAIKARLEPCVGPVEVLVFDEGDSFTEIPTALDYPDDEPAQLVR